MNEKGEIEKTLSGVSYTVKKPERLGFLREEEATVDDRKPEWNIGDSGRIEGDRGFCPFMTSQGAGNLNPCGEGCALFKIKPEGKKQGDWRGCSFKFIADALDDLIDIIDTRT